MQLRTDSWSMADSSDSAPHVSVALKASNCVGFVILIVVNYLSAAGKLGPTNADVSHKYETPLTPAGYAFSIWGLIFLLQAIFVIYQALPVGYGEHLGIKEREVAAVGYFLQATWYMECLWQMAFVRENVSLAFLLILAAVVFAHWALIRLYKLAHELASLPDSAWSMGGGAPEPTNLLESAALALRRWGSLSITISTSVNAAWLLVATVVSLLIIPVAHSMHPPVWVAVILTLFVAIVALSLLSPAVQDIGYGATVLWALHAIDSKQRVASRSLHLWLLLLQGLLVLALLAAVAATRAIMWRQSWARARLASGAQPLLGA
eukprot:jgi/Mesvir1/24931/Mv16909-RA.1